MSQLPSLTRASLDLLKIGPERKNNVIFLLTNDNSGYPRVCLLSPFQILALDATHVVVSIYKSSKTNLNLRNQGKGTLVIITPPSIQYVQIELDPKLSRQLGETEEVHHFVVRDGRVDYSEEAPIIEALKFDLTRIKDRYEKGFELLSLKAKGN